MINEIPNFRGKEHGDGIRIGLPLVTMLITIASIIAAVVWQAGKFAEKTELAHANDVIWLQRLETDRNTEEIKHLRELIKQQESCITNVVQRRESRR